jgi:ATP-dependent Clp protease adapter protein ClpS
MGEELTSAPVSAVSLDVLKLDDLSVERQRELGRQWALASPPLRLDRRLSGLQSAVAFGPAIVGGGVGLVAGILLGSANAYATVALPIIALGYPLTFWRYAVYKKRKRRAVIRSFGFRDPKLIDEVDRFIAESSEKFQRQIDSARLAEDLRLALNRAQEDNNLSAANVCTHVLRSLELPDPLRGRVSARLLAPDLAQAPHTQVFPGVVASSAGEIHGMTYLIFCLARDEAPTELLLELRRVHTERTRPLPDLDAPTGAAATLRVFNDDLTTMELVRDVFMSHLDMSEGEALDAMERVHTEGFGDLKQGKPEDLEVIAAAITRDAETAGYPLRVRVVG